MYIKYNFHGKRLSSGVGICNEGFFRGEILAYFEN